MQFEYERKSVEKLFEDFNLILAKHTDIARSLKKICNQLKASRNWGIYLSTGMGKPHSLEGNYAEWIGICITGHKRLLIKPADGNFDPVALNKCERIIIGGVVDYHGSKTNWIIP